MSTEYSIGDPFEKRELVTYEAFMTELPAGIASPWRSSDALSLCEAAPGLAGRDHDRRSIYVMSIPHAVLIDACGNVMAVRAARPADVEGHTEGFLLGLGEAIFEQWGMGGRALHFDEAIHREYGEGLFDFINGFLGDEHCGICTPKEGA